MRGDIPPFPQYAFMAWCLVKHRDNFAFTFNIYREVFRLFHRIVAKHFVLFVANLSSVIVRSIVTLQIRFNVHVRVSLNIFTFVLSFVLQVSLCPHFRNTNQC
jgi:hypothetical protein